MAPKNLVRVPMDMEPAEQELPKAIKALADALNTNVDAAQTQERVGPEVKGAKLSAFRDLVIKMPTDAPWRDLTLAGGVSNAATDAPGYLMEPGGLVALRGLVTGMTVPGNIATLPAGYWPSDEIGVLSESSNVPEFAALRVTAAGVVKVLYTATVAPYAFLNAFRFVAKNAAAPHRFSANGWPMIIQHDLPRVTGVNVVSCRARGVVGAEAAGSPYVDAEDRGDGTLRIHAVWGLQWGKTYDVRVLLSAEG